MDRAVPLIVNAEIRRATARDLAALATWSAPANEVLKTAIDSDDRVLLIAHANGRFPIGHVLVDYHGILSHLLVLGGFREQGLGTALMDEAEGLLREKGLGHASLVVDQRNEGAIRLYERLGYVRSGETGETWMEAMPDGTVEPVTVPCWVMRKEL